jgi:alpha-1,2-glucosyltransferase
MDDQTLPRGQARGQHGVLWLAIASIVLYFLALTIFNNGPIADEEYHLRGVRWFCDGHWRPPDFLPMLPGYHVLAAVPARVFGTQLVVLRAFNTLLAIGTILLVHRVLRVMNRPNPDDALLHFAWNPLLLPFMALVYTDLPAMLCLVGAVYLHVRRRFVLSAVALLAACLLRQSNVVWVAFMAVWAIVELRQELSADSASQSTAGLGGFLRRAVLRVWPHLALGLLAAAFFLIHGQATLGDVRLNSPAVNVAQLYLFALFVALLWAPVWVHCLRSEWRTLYRSALMRPLVWALLTAAAAFLMLNFDNPHPWNEDLRDLRNWPLVTMSSSLGARLIGVLLIVAAIPIVVRFTWRQPHRRMLAVVWLFSFLFLLPQWLAEPRYYIVPVFLLNLFAAYTPSQARRVTVWYGATGAATATVTCIWGGAAGGVL